jgi:hypothetical protein
MAAHYVVFSRTRIGKSNRNSNDAQAPLILYTLLSEITGTRFYTPTGATIMTELIIYALIVILAGAVSLYRLLNEDEAAVQSAEYEYWWWMMPM